MDYYWRVTTFGEDGDVNDCGSFNYRTNAVAKLRRILLSLMGIDSDQQRIDAKIKRFDELALETINDDVLGIKLEFPLTRYLRLSRVKLVDAPEQEVLPAVLGTVEKCNVTVDNNDAHSNIIKMIHKI